MLSNVQFILICGIRIASRESQKKELSKLTHRQLRNRHLKWRGAFCPARIWLEKDKMFAFRGPWSAQKIFSWMPEWLIRSAGLLGTLLSQNKSQVRWTCCSLPRPVSPTHSKSMAFWFTVMKWMKDGSGPWFTSHFISFISRANHRWYMKSHRALIHFYLINFKTIQSHFVDWIVKTWILWPSV